MKDRLALVGLLCLLPIAAAWLVIREAQWSRRRGFYGTYEQPLEPPLVDLGPDVFEYGVGSDMRPELRIGNGRRT